MTDNYHNDYMGLLTVLLTLADPGRLGHFGRLGPLWLPPPDPPEPHIQRYNGVSQGPRASRPLRPVSRALGSCGLYLGLWAQYSLVGAQYSLVGPVQPR